METWLRILTYSFPAGRIFGIPLRLHWMMLLVAAFLLAGTVRQLSESGAPPWMPWAIGAMYLVVLYGSILLHELGHCWGMRLVGIEVQEIQLTPIGGVAMGSGQEISPRTELIHVALGPAVTIALALLGWGGGALTARFWPGAPLLVPMFFTMLAGLNLYLALFNLLLPALPLDGARMLRAALSLKIDPQRVTRALCHVGIGTCIVLFLASLFRVRLPLLGEAGTFLMLIAFIGGQYCFHTLRSLEYGPVYTGHDSWGGDRPRYYDAESIARAKRLAADDLRFRRSARFRKGAAPKERAVFVTPHRQAAIRRRGEAESATIRGITRDPSKIDDPEELRALMREAADMEDFELAARLKKRLDELTPG